MEEILNQILEAQKKSGDRAWQAAEKMQQLQASIEAVAQRLKVAKEQNEPGLEGAIKEIDQVLNVHLTPKLVSIKQIHAHNQKFLKENERAILHALGTLMVQHSNATHDLTGLLFDHIAAGQALADDALKKLSGNTQIDQPKFQ